MKRKQFLKLSGFSAASLFFTRSYAAIGSTRTDLHFPAKIAVLTGGQWQSLTGSKECWTLGQLVVTLQHTTDGMSVLVQSPSMAIEKLRLAWDWSFQPAASWLGDAWERSYGDLSWTSGLTSQKAPWYLLVNDGTQTHAFGVKTGAKTFCYWQASPQQLELFLDTHSGGVGVELGDRALHAAEIVTTQSTPGKTPFIPICVSVSSCAKNPGSPQNRCTGSTTGILPTATIQRTLS